MFYSITALKLFTIKIHTQNHCTLFFKKKKKFKYRPLTESPSCANVIVQSDSFYLNKKKELNMSENDKKSSPDNTIQELYQALLLLKTPQEVNRFLKDLCTPQEIQDMAERWKICKILNEEKLSYREINAQTGVSLATIGRIARFLNNEPHQGYQLILDRLNRKR